MRRARTVLAAVPGAARRALPRLRALHPDELVLLLLAPVALPAVALALRRSGLAAVRGRLEARAAVTAGRRELSTVEQVAAARRIAWCVQVAAAYSLWRVNCLHRSVVLCWFLARRGIPYDLRIGVRRGDDGVLDFHAWVEHEGEVLNDRRDVTTRYAVFSAPTGSRHRWTG